jgi:hypothetical protein
MTESDSTPSTSRNSSADNNPLDTAPYMKNKPDNSDESTHGYFIPVVMALVFGVIIISTFYSREFNNLLAGIVSSDPGEQLTSNVKEKFYAKSNAIQQSANVAATTTSAETGGPAESNTNVSASASSTITSTISPGDTRSEPSAEKDEAISHNSLASIQSQPAYPARSHNHAAPLPYAPPPANYALPGEWNAYNELMLQRRRAYEQAQREHLKRLDEYRAAVMNRIEQDRVDMLRHMQELAQESQRRRDEFIHRMDQFDNTSMDRPI